jgi:hypothetical protein
MNGAADGGRFGFVAGCIWGDDSSWKVQYLGNPVPSNPIRSPPQPPNWPPDTAGVPTRISTTVGLRPQGGDRQIEPLR